MKRKIKVFTAFLLAVVLAFGSQVASAFADTPNPNRFQITQGQQQTVILDPTKTSFHAEYSNESDQTQGIVKVEANFCDQITIIDPNAFFQGETYDCGQTAEAIFKNIASPTISVLVSQ
ncbi:MULTISPECIES: hypothetical protein [Moorena]|nr:MULTISPECIES: hypothetical protein [Moorena]NEO17657.1 hypothetical protein [Moorena sp. SIO3E8]NEP97890.1 hypothetical protein [Moorena sp. SIO3F7]